ncbi:hypothetical protein [Sulfurimonas microaerophilic]|uniref:hypothetical protein n=1 Tax=Sulfurimonas microaerophilic TaxID=3058392 RepID=UPI0027152ADF|nr:hypothetical protein [Sulfurimonas sp. hsl 1-7]
MEQMYAMGVNIHSIGILLLIFAIIMNIVLLYQAEDSEKYKRLRSVFLLPLNSMLVAAAIFTGTIMMAAKHLDFTLENILMIIVAITLIVKEVRRSKALKHVDDDEFIDFVVYKQFAFKIMYFEFFIVVAISIWMWFFS